MPDIVIKNAKIVDGTGSDPFYGNVEIVDDMISAITEPGATSGAAKIYDADGLILTPGFVDLHSHLDAQIGWDPLMSSSCWHGVTTVVTGNCGMTFAPVRPGQARALAGAMESVEDIPAESIIAGMSWSWESFPDYLDEVDRLDKGINVAGMVGDVALRMYVIGDEAAEPDFKATPAQLAAMAEEVDKAIEAGAIGYSISRSLTHRVPDGRWVPGTWSDPTEYFEIAKPLARRNQGVLECAPRYNETDGSTWRVDEEMRWIADLSRSLGRPFSFNLMQMRSMGDHYRRVIELAEQANASGAKLRPQMTPRSIGVLFSLAANSLIDSLESFKPYLQEPLEKKLALLDDDSFRTTLLEEAKAHDTSTFDRMFPMQSERANYRYQPSESLMAQAQKVGQNPIEFYVDLLRSSRGKAIVNWPVANENFAAIEELIRAEVTIMGLADSGAHATQIMDASQATFFLSHWVRDEGVASLQAGIRRLSGDTAEFLGLTKRGTIKVGNYADLNLIDLEALEVGLPHIVHDFPLGAPRFIQQARGIEHTFVNGTEFMASNKHTGELRGRLLRSSPDPVAA